MFHPIDDLKALTNWVLPQPGGPTSINTLRFQCSIASIFLKSVTLNGVNSDCLSANRLWESTLVNGLALSRSAWRLKYLSKFTRLWLVIRLTSRIYKLLKFLGCVCHNNLKLLCTLHHVPLSVITAPETWEYLCKGLIGLRYILIYTRN